MSFTITGAVIVRDEECCIRRCIENLLPLFDEIVVVDTGSVDETLSILYGFKSDKLRVIKTIWADDFSAARNLAIKKATCDYIFFVDADEYITSSKDKVTAAFNRINDSKNKNYFALCPIIQDHDSNKTRTVRRGFLNNHCFQYSGYVHEELRRLNGEIIDVCMEIDIIHDGYLPEVLKNKGKVERNKALNIKNINREPHYLRWRYFYYRDSFEKVPADDVYKELYDLIILNEKSPLSASNIKADPYTFPVIDLMARAKLKLFDNSEDFFSLIKIMNQLIPGNSNAFYYTLIHDLCKWKILARNKVREIISYKKKNVNNSDMLHSSGLHIDAALSFYLCEAGLKMQAKKLLESVRLCGFSTDLVEYYIHDLSVINNGNMDGKI